MQAKVNVFSLSQSSCKCLRRKVSRSGAGFTLIELLLSVSLGAILLTAVYAAYSGAMRSTQRIEHVSSELQAWRFFVERLRADLVNLQILHGEGEVGGGPHDLTFSVIEEETPIQLRYMQDKSGRSTLIRREVKQENGVSSTVVFEGPEEVAFRYLTEEGWSDRFEGVGELPRALQCAVVSGGIKRLVTIGIEVEPVRQAEAE